MISLIAIPLALTLDRFLGEPPQFHPLVGFGYLANTLESRLNKGENRLLKGILAWLLAVLPIVLLVYFLDQWLQGWGEDRSEGSANWLFSALCGWLAIGWKSLRQHGLTVLTALSTNKLEQARQKTSYLVSRDTTELDSKGMSRATIESILENGSDAIFAPLFWLIIAGAPGVVLYRLINTLDAMWGYHNDRFEYFGKFAARVDDLFNYIPARITALLYALSGNSPSAMRAWKTQGKNWYSPNAGIVMATGAGALNIKLGGTAIYQGVTKNRLSLGEGNDPEYIDIQHAIDLLDRSIYLFLAGLFFFVFIAGLWLGPDVIFNT